MTELKGICPYCLGCNRLENETFPGFYRCTSFMPNQMNWQDLYREKATKGAKEK